MELNWEQKKVLKIQYRPIVVIAGPGTGKTRTLVAKLQNLITSQKNNPSKILALTFTRKASQEIKERLKDNFKNKAFIGTFHSLAFQFVSQVEQFEIENDEDYERLLLEFLELLKNKKINLNFSHVLVDEFQDTSEVQYEILKIISPKNIIVIGDPYQSIYSFRGANFGIFEAFKKDFPEYREIKLSENYRSYKNITTVSQKLFPEITKLHNIKKEEGEVKLIEFLNHKAEADFIVSTIMSGTGGVDLNSVNEGDQKFSDFAVIYRNHFLRESVENALKQSGIPYQMVGGGSIWEKKETKSLIEKIKKYEGREDKLSKLVKKFSEDSEILSLVKRFDKYKDGIKRFLEYVEDLEGREFYDPNLNCVTLLTMHASKGLEFENVFIIGFEENFNEKRSDIDEEKRLLYVSMTRAKQKLYLMYSRRRNGKVMKVSRFLKDLRDEKLIEMIDPKMEKIIKRIERKKLKKAQISLF
ncbi:MAG: ATP-dependent helicase [Candidatus Woesebacteria bacterium]|nr:MAG: ATP-dependent helicase [Candidatus Woesebacteria bacterium]